MGLKEALLTTRTHILFFYKLGSPIWRENIHVSKKHIITQMFLQKEK